MPSIATPVLVDPSMRFLQSLHVVEAEVGVAGGRDGWQSRLSVVVGV